MANTFKVVSHDVMPASSGTPEDLYTCTKQHDYNCLGHGACKRTHQPSHSKCKAGQHDIRWWACSN